MTKYVKSIKFSTSGETYEIRDAEQKSRLDTLEPIVGQKQDELVSGTNIKTINNLSLLGSGNITIGGGSGGTTNYDDLTNKPTINSVTLDGNKTSADLGLAAASALSEHTSDSNIHVTSTEKTAWSNKQEALVSGTNIKTINNQSLLGSGNISIGGGSGTSDYDQLDNRPKINDVTLTGSKTSSDLGLMPNNFGSEHADKFLAVNTDGSLKFADAPEAAALESRVSALEDDMSELIDNESSTVDIVTAATTHETAKYMGTGGSTTSSTSWEYFGIANDGFTSIEYGLYTGASTSFDHIDFWNSTSLSSSTKIGSVPITQASSYVTGTAEVPAGTVYITVNNKRLTGTVVNTPTIIATKVEKGTIPALQDEVALMESELAELVKKSVKEGLRIAVIGDSISTRESLKTPEIVVQPEDIGVQLGAWVTIYDPLPMTLGGVEYTTADIGKYITFTPVAEDVGKRIGTEHIYSGNANTKVWWQYLADLGATMINGTYCSASMSSHEKSVQRLCTAHSWHDQQIRRLGKRIPGTMQRQAPDIIIMYRGCNDMTHTQYDKLTDGYFNTYNWAYPTDDVITGGYGFKEALSIWVSKLRKVYPRAQIVFATQNTFKRIVYNRFPTNNGIYSLPTFNKAIREAADFFGCKTIDFDKDGVTFENCYPTYISDSADIPTHPNATGHRAMALQAITDLDSKLDLFNFEPLNLMGKVDHHIISKLEDATLSNTTTVYTGDSYTGTITPASGASLGTVTVTMGGVNVTSTAYDQSTNTISISNVTGDIIVTNVPAPVETVALTKNFTNVTTTTGDTLTKNAPAVVELTADDGYMISNVTVTMGGTDITASSYVYYANGAEVRIANVTEAVTITATATYVNEGYKILKGLVGLSNQAVITDISSTDINRCLTKISVTTPTSRNGFGCFGDIFCNVNTTSPLTFTTGSTNGDTGVTVEVGEYLVNLVDIDQTTSNLEIYAGDDTGLTNRLGLGTRDTAPRSEYFSFCGFNTSTAGVDYGCTGEAFHYSYMYDSSNNIIHSFVPARQLASDANGIYDIVTGVFYGFAPQNTTFVNVTKTLSHVKCSASSKLKSGSGTLITLTADDGYVLDKSSIVVTVGGTDVTSTALEYFTNNAEIVLASVSADVAITASATSIGSDYRAMKELFGQTSKFIQDDKTYLNTSRIFAKIDCVSPRSNQGWGFYGYAFCNEYLNPTLDLITFNLGVNNSTNIQAESGHQYVINIKDIATGTCTLEIYNGNDEGMDTRLGYTTRTVGSVHDDLTWCAFDHWEDAGTYETTGQGMFWAKVYDASGNLDRDYIPVTKISTGEQGFYDLVHNSFLGFTVHIPA